MWLRNSMITDGSHPPHVDPDPAQTPSSTAPQPTTQQPWIITRQAIRRGTFTSVADLIGAIRIFIDAYNQRCEPFTWTKTADQILTKADRQKTSDTEH